MVLDRLTAQPYRVRKPSHPLYEDFWVLHEQGSQLVIETGEGQMRVDRRVVENALDRGLIEPAN